MDYIRLENTDFEGKNNIYLLRGSDSVTLVDTGMATDEMRAQFRDGIDRFDFSIADVDQIFLTHWHPDHVGLAGEIKAESGATVYMHEGDAPLVENRAWVQMEERYEALFEEWGMPEDKREEVRIRFEREDERLSGELIDVETFEGGDTFEAADRQLEAVHLPGHTVGMSGFKFEGADGPELFSGDALLPVYTPNVGGADVRVESPLERYLETLAQLVDTGYVRAWPGHRDVIDDPAGRAREIVAHHRERTGKIVGVLDEHGPIDAWTVGEHLFGELDDIHILHGPGEAYAHLDHLERHGIVTFGDEGYALESPDADLDALFPDVE